jgi:hypothetical protein
MTTIVTIPVPFRDRIPAAQRYVDAVALRDSSWNGAPFAVGVGILQGSRGLLKRRRAERAIWSFADHPGRP